MRERPFEVECAGRRVPGVLWAPDDRRAPWPLVLAGHGFTLHKRALFPLTLPADLAARGFAVAAIDAPGHGDRQPDRGRDAVVVDRAWRAHWREFGAAQIAEEYVAALDALLAMPEIDASRAGYWGLSLATQYGVGVLARETRIRAAVLGLSALPDPGPRLAAYAEQVTCPVFFILQEDDEVAAPTRARALFDRLAASDKTLRSRPGRHMDVPRAVLDEASAWLIAKLT